MRLSAGMRNDSVKHRKTILTLKCQMAFGHVGASDTTSSTPFPWIVVDGRVACHKSGFLTSYRAPNPSLMNRLASWKSKYKPYSGPIDAWRNLVCSTISTPLAAWEKTSYSDQENLCTIIPGKKKSYAWIPYLWSGFIYDKAG